MDRAIEKLFDNVKEVHFETRHRVTRESKEIWMYIMIGDEPSGRVPAAFRDMCAMNQKIIMDKVEEYLSAHFFNYQFLQVTEVRDIPETEKQKIRTMYMAS